MVIYKTIHITHHIMGFDKYGFGSDKKLYNLHTGRQKNQSLNGGSIGYWLGRKFITLTALRPKLYKPKKESLPF